MPGEPRAERCDRKKALKQAAKRELVAVLQTEHGLSERRACAAVGFRTLGLSLPAATKCRWANRQTTAGAGDDRNRGFGKLFKRLRRMGHGWNHKRVYRIYCALKLNKRRKGKRRLPTRCPAPLVVPETMNERWSADFMSDALWYSRRFRTFNVVDGFNREALAIEVDLNLPAQRIVRERWIG